MLYDCIIIGTGAAGVSAAINLKIHEKSFLLIGDADLSAKFRRAELVRNYPGLPDITGAALADAYLLHLQKMGIEITDKMVSSAAIMKDRCAVFAGADYYESRTLILATGAAATGTLPGEESLVGRGVSYCATCDGGLYRGRDIAVIISSARFEHEVRYLAGLASKVYVYPTYAGAKFSSDNIVMMKSRATAILSGEDGKVCAVRSADGEETSVSGVFCLRESVSLSTLLPKLKVEDGRISVDREMRTNIPFVFAAGDCTGRPYQYVKAAGEGNVAAHSVIEYLG